MRSVHLQLQLIDDVLISETSATAGGHESLDYIPGATLLGAAAAKLYNQLSGEEQYCVFHSGRLRFGNALPLTADGERCYPMPFAWHERKLGPSAINEGKIDAAALIDPRASNDQPEQLRRGYVTESLAVERPERRMRMKTAIDPRTQRVATGQLFGYEAIAAGTVFCATVEADTDVPQALLDRVVGALVGQLRLGRSRSAEYGRVHVTQVSPTKAPTKDGPQIGMNEKELTLWLLSDMALLDSESAQPTLEPSAMNLGLPAHSEWDATRSYLRVRHYAPFNGKRQSRDPEISVIRQGSVLRYTLREPLSAADQQRLAAGVGLYREAGLGCVWINPALLATVSPVSSKGLVFSVSKARASVNADHPLIAWMAARAEDAAARPADRETAYKMAKALKQLYVTARRLGGVADRLPVGPSPSQWSTIMSAAKEGLGKDALLSKLFDKSNGVCPERDNWEQEGIAAQTHTTFRAWLKKSLEDCNAANMTYVVSTLARRAQDIAKKEGCHGH